jgi:hypothetical protein
MATVAAFHRIGGGRQQLVVQKRQGFFKVRREDLFSGVANPREPFHPLTQFPQPAQCGLRPTTPVKQRINVVHDLTQGAQLRQATGEAHESLAFRWRQAAFDEQKAILEQVTDFLLHRFALTREAASRFVFGRWSAALHFWLGRGQARAPRPQLSRPLGSGP